MAERDGPDRPGPGRSEPVGDRIRHAGPPAEDTSPGAIASLKEGRTISVCIPCRNEAPTVGSIVGSIRSELAEVVDELVVVDDRSTDRTAEVARHAGARVVSTADVEADHGPGSGKGNALWTSLLSSSGDLVVWCDADVTSFEPSWVCRLAYPLLTEPEVALVKARTTRPTDRGGGGRTTELVARPLLSRFFPALTQLAQPLAGEYAGRRDVLESIPFVEGWGVEIAMLIDVLRDYGASALAEIDLGERIHRHRDLHALSLQAAEVTSTVLLRAGVEAEEPAVLRHPDGSEHLLNLRERPPLRSLELRRVLAS
jgi:glucosyl-3-phosphoglycerate synthase